MEKYILSNPLFNNISLQKYKQLLNLIPNRVLSLQKNDFVVKTGDYLKEIGIVVKGKLVVISESVEGIDSIVNEIEPGSSFGEAMVATSTTESPFAIYCLQDSQIFFLDYKHLLENAQDDIYNQLICNLMNILAKKVMNLNYRFIIASQRKLKDKLLYYLYMQKNIHKSNSFKIDLNREQLAAYLFVNRSALSYVLMQLKKEGLLDYHKNYFTLK